jgi:hypothetical protein
MQNSFKFLPPPPTPLGLQTSIYLLESLWTIIAPGIGGCLKVPAYHLCGFLSPTYSLTVLPCSLLLVETALFNTQA